MTAGDCTCDRCAEVRRTLAATFPDQRALADQMRDLVALANERGMYDAAEWIERRFARRQPNRFRVAKVQEILDDTFNERGELRP